MTTPFHGRSKPQSQGSSNVNAPQCRRCNKQHFGLCNNGACYRCGQLGHKARECLMNSSGYGVSNQMQSQNAPITQSAASARTPIASSKSNKGKGITNGNSARVYTLTRQEAQASNAVVTGIIIIDNLQAQVLFDPGATHSFVSKKFATSLNRSYELLESLLTVVTPIGKTMIASQMLRACPVNLGDKLVFANLILLDIADYDVILGMDWLSQHHACMNCFDKTVTFQVEVSSSIVFQGEQIAKMVS